MNARQHHEVIAAAAGLSAEAVGGMLLGFSILLRPVLGAIRTGITKAVKGSTNDKEKPPC